VRKFGETVGIDCLFYLDAPQGSEGFLEPCSSEVICSAADRCPVLLEGGCPLADIYATVLNEMEVRTLRGERGLLLEDDGTVYDVGDVRPDGYVIWFGVTTISGTGGARYVPRE